MAAGQNPLKIFIDLFGPQRPLSMPWAVMQRWSFFFVSALLLVVLCVQGGRWGVVGSHPFSVELPLWGEYRWTVPAGGFMLLWGAIFAAGILNFLTLPRHLSPFAMAMVLFLLALVCRLALLPHPPSNDVYRYLWEGRLITQGLNPYRLAPDDPVLASLAAGVPWHAKINHPHLTAIYPPLSLYIMALSVLISDSLMGVKVLVVGVDLITLAVILKLLHQRGLNLRWAGLYAFNPVILYAFAGEGHLDVFQNFFLLLAVYCYYRRSWWVMFPVLGLAIQSKYMATAAIPFFIRRENWRYSPLLAVTAGVPFIPLVDGSLHGFFSTLTIFANRFAFNGSLHGILRLLLGDIFPATYICKILYGIALLWGWVRLHPTRSHQTKDDPLPGVMFTFTLLILLSPTVHFWYLSWGILFLPLHPSTAWMVLSLSIGAYFAAPANQFLTGRFYLPAGSQILIWALPWALFLKESSRFFGHSRWAAKGETLRSVSVVVPALNESARVHACVAKLNRDSAVIEVIVVDGGSTDHTVAEAERAGARVLVHANSPEDQGGRGGQISKGLCSARGDVVAVVHADTIADEPAFGRVLQVLNLYPMVIGGALGTRFDGKGWRHRLLELANDARTVSTGISFGDQIQFFRRKPVLAAEIYPNQPLMEDVEFALRLKRMGKLVYFFGTGLVSARGWQPVRFRRVWKVLRLFLSYLLQRLFRKPDTAAMYRCYYHGKKELS